MEISEQPVLAGFEDELQFCQQGCPASQPPLPGSAEAAKMTVGSGRQCSMLLEVSSPLGLFSRILLGSSHWTSSEEYCYVWNRLDTRFALSAFKLTPLGQSTEESGCSLWRTPNASDVTGGGQDGQKRLNAGHAMQLSDQIMNAKLWPTPVVNDARNGRNATANRSDPNSQHHTGTTLSDAVRLWPTPTVPNGGRRNPEGTSITGRKPDGGKAQIDLREFAIRIDDSPSGSLNPRFVEELMGFPIDHTALKRSGTPLSRSKPTRFSKQSR